MWLLSLGYIRYRKDFGGLLDGMLPIYWGLKEEILDIFNLHAFVFWDERTRSSVNQDTFLVQPLGLAILLRAYEKLCKSRSRQLSLANESRLLSAVQ
jgi:hypothetical protein